MALLPCLEKWREFKLHMLGVKEEEAWRRVPNPKEFKIKRCCV